MKVGIKMAKEKLLDEDIEILGIDYEKLEKLSKEELVEFIRKYLRLKQKNEKE